MGHSRPAVGAAQAVDASSTSQRAAVVVEQASFYEHGGDRTKESFRVENSTLSEVAEGRRKESFKISNNTLNDIADGSGLGRAIIAHAKAVWDAAEASGRAYLAPSPCHG